MKKNLTTTFIQLLRIKKLKTKLKKYIVKKIMKKEEKRKILP
jgi:hypothetical protein